MFVYTLVASAQSYDSAIQYRLNTPSYHLAMEHFINDALVSPYDTGEERASAVLERRKLWLGSRICNDVSVGSNLVAPMNSALSSYMTYYNSYCPGSSYSGNWNCLGPFINYYGTITNEHNGRIDAIWVHPLDTGHILIGANGGGLWKTNNGGLSWRCITDGAMGTSSSVLGMAGVQSIAVNPSDTNMIYIAQGGREQSKKSNSYGLGLVYTTDGGASWHSDGSFNTLVSTSHLPHITKISYMPGTQKLFGISETKVLYKPSPTDPWQDITPTGFSPSGDRWCFDMEFTNSPSGKVVVSFGALSNTAHFCTYNPSTGTWTYMPIVLTGYTLPDYHYGAINFSLSTSDNAYIQFRAKDGSGNHASLLIKSPITTFSQNIRNYNFTDQDYGTGSLMRLVSDFAVSPANSDIIYAVNYNNGGPILISTDEGASFSSYLGEGHADGNALFIHSATNTANGINDVVYIGNDGGIRKKRYGTTSFSGITGNGLCITQFFGFGNTEADDRIVMGGAQDNSAFTYIKQRTNPWKNVHTGFDGYTAKFANNGVTKAFGEYNSPSSPPYPMYGIEISGTTDGEFSVSTPTDTAISNINRPQYFNPQNTAFVGYSYIWKKSYNPTTFWNFGGSNWERAFSLDPINYDESHSFHQIVVDFKIDENNSNNVYIAYRDAVGRDLSGTPYDYTSSQYGKLYFSNNADNITPTWLNITPDITVDNGINTIMVDPKNPARIWVGFGNVNNALVGTSPEFMKKRVLYSNSYGAPGTWVDVSKGLSALPVNKLLYRKGSDDEMYAGTDAGVFKWNKVASQWECFNSGLPPCTVMDMEFNYCSNKLRIATFARGIWETPLQNIWDIVQLGEEITSNVTWTQDRYVTGAVRVKSGNKLTIQRCAIHMPRNGAIIVEKGAKLVVDSAILTNNCDGCLWYGIEAIGNPLAAQSPASNQAWIVIKNNSRVEHARYGVSNCDYWNDPSGTTGGIIQASNSTFYNNHNSITLLQYHAPGSPTAPNLSYFTNCTFLNDANYRGYSFGYYMQNHVDLRGVDGVRFSGCKFLNRDWRLALGSGVGISSFNSSFKVEPYCADALMYPGTCTDLRRSRFSGLEDGIVIKDVIGIGASVSIDQADFDSSAIGILISGQNNVSTTRCNFIVGRGDALDTAISNLNVCGNIGIAILNSLLFKMEGNTFKGKPHYSSMAYSSWNTFGAVISNTGVISENKVFRNSFDSLTQGVRCIGNNRGTYMGATYGAGGLQILCNAFSHNNVDIAITPDGTAGLQGLGFETGYYGRPAKNTFSGSIYNILNNCPYINYHYDEANSSTEKPSIVSSNVWRLATNNGTSCAATYTSSGGVGAFFPVAADKSALELHKSTFNASKVAYDSLRNVYISVMDSGYPPTYLQGQIDTASDATRLYSLLLSASPYLSDKILKHITTSTILSYDLMDSLFLKNPEGLRHDSVYRHVSSFFATIQQNDPQLSDYVSSLTSAANDSFTVRAEFEALMSGTNMLMHDEASTILFALKSPIDTAISLFDTTGAGFDTDTSSVYYTLDSMALYSGLDSLDTWLRNIGGFEADIERVGYYNYLKQYQTADSIFNNISRSSLPSEAVGSYDTYKDVWSVIHASEIDGRSVYQLDSTDISLLDTFTAPEYSPNRARQVLWNISRSIVDFRNVYDQASALSAAGGPLYPTYSFPCIISVLSSSKPGSTSPDRSSNISILPVVEGLNITKSKLSVYPNPAADIVTFEFSSPQSRGAVTVTITNILGMKVIDLQIMDSERKQYWNTESYPSGVYLYRVTGEHGIIGNGKILLNK